MQQNYNIPRVFIVETQAGTERTVIMPSLRTAPRRLLNAILRGLPAKSITFILHSTFIFTQVHQIFEPYYPEQANTMFPILLGPLMAKRAEESRNVVLYKNHFHLGHCITFIQFFQQMVQAETRISWMGYFHTPKHPKH